MPRTSVAERIRVYRVRRGLSQVRLAIAIGRSESWLSQVERGERLVDRLSVLSKIAEVLNIPVTELTGDPPAVTAPHSAEHSLTRSLRAVLSGHDYLFQVAAGRTTRGARKQRSLAVVPVRKLWTLAHASRYKELAELLPHAINLAELNARAASLEKQRAAFADVAKVYQVGAAVAAKLGQTDIAWVMADRSVIAAERSDDQLLAIAGDLRLAHAFLSGGRQEQALRASTSGGAAAEQMDERSYPGTRHLLGALRLAAGVAYSRLGEEREAKRMVEQARVLADGLPPDTRYDTEFGTANVDAHDVAISIELGHPSEALRTADRMDVSTLSAERRARVLIDVARAHGQRRDIRSAVRALLEAIDIAPEQVEDHWAVRELVRNLVYRERNRASPDLRLLATRLRLDA